MLQFSMFNFLKFQCNSNSEENFSTSRKTINVEDIYLPEQNNQENSEIQNSDEENNTYPINNRGNSEYYFLKTQKRIKNVFLIVTIIFLLSHLIYLFYKKEAKYTSFLFLSIFGFGIGFDNSKITRFYSCLALSLLLIPLVYKALFDTKLSGLDKFMYLLFFIYLNVQIVFIFNGMSIFLLILSGLLTFLVIFLGKTFFSIENSKNTIDFSF